MVISDVSSVGDTNKLAILREVIDREGTSREELAKRLQLSPPAVSKNVATLIRAGILYENGTGDTTIGRKPSRLYCNYDVLYVIAVEIMPKGIRAALANFKGEILRETSSPSEIEKGSRKTVDNLLTVIDEMISYVPDKSRISHICVASPGSGKNANEWNLFSDYQPDWIDIDLKEIISAHCGIDVTVRNDVEMDLIGEYWCGAGRGSENVMLLKYGDGLACRMLANGIIFKGAHGIAGDVGRSIWKVGNENGMPEKIEDKFCLSLGKLYAEASGKSDIPEKLPVAWLIQAAKNEDEAAREVMKNAVESIPGLLTKYVLTMDPEKIILGGECVDFTDDWIDLFKKYISEYCPYPPVITKAKLMGKSGLYGCIRNGIDNSISYLENLWKCEVLTDA